MQIDRFINRMWTSETIFNKTKCTKILTDVHYWYTDHKSLLKSSYIFTYWLFFCCVWWGYCYLLLVMWLPILSTTRGLILLFSWWLLCSLSIHFMCCVCAGRKDVRNLFPLIQFYHYKIVWKFHTGPNPYCFSWFITMTDIRLDLVEY